MEVQSNNIAASLFDGLSQSQQTQGTATKNDLFSKMMDRMLTDAAARKREQADAAARDSAKDAAKDAAKEAARDARAAEAQRRQPVRAEPKPDPNRAAQAARQPDDADATRAAGPKAGKTDDDQKVQARQDDRRPTKAEKPVKDQSKTDGAKTAADKTATAKAGGADDAGTAAAADDATRSGATGQADSTDTADMGADMGADDGDATAGDAAADAQSANQPSDQSSILPQPTPPQPAPQTSDLILAGLTIAGQATEQAAATDGGDGASAGAAADGAGATGTADPAAQLAQTQAAQAQAAAAGAMTREQATAAKAADKTGAAATADAGQTAATADADGQAGAQALPTDDDSALPDRFADLLAAAKAKTGEAKQTGKQSGNEAAGRTDTPIQPQPTMQQPVPTAAPAARAAEAVTAAATGDAAKALDAVGGTGSAGGASTASGASPHTHPALAAMEGLHGGLPSLDQPQATATLRPSRGAGMPMGVQDQIAVHIKKSVADEVDQFTINLHPAELGRIDIKLDIGADGRVNAMVAVEKAQTLELLQRDSRGLERALQDAGLQTDSNSLNFSLRGEGNPFAGDGRGDGKGGGTGRRGRGFGGDGDEDGADGAVYTATLGNGRVDIRA